MRIQNIMLLSVWVGGALLGAAPSTETVSEESVAPYWHSRYAAAARQATEENKVLVIYFHLQDACPWCKKQEKEVFESPEFAAYARQKLVLLKVDRGPKAKALPIEIQEENAALVEDFDIAQSGYPTVVFINHRKNLTKKQAGYSAGGPRAFIAQAEQIL